MGFAGAPLRRVGAGPAREMALHQEHARRAQVRGRSRRRCLRRREWRTRAPSDGHGRSGSPRQPGLHEARFGIVEGTAPANLEGDPTMRTEANSRTQKLTSEDTRNLLNLDTKDETLVAESVRGSSAAFEVLFQRYQQKMFHVALSRLQNTQDAEDAVQQTFQQAFVHLKRFQGQSRFSTWLTRIAINEALMLLRKRRPGHFSIEGHQTVDEESFTLEIKDRAATPEEEYGQLEIHNVLSGAIDELRPILKTVVNLSEIGELSTRKTAETLGVRVGTVKARTFRARRLLRDKIAKRLGARADRAAVALFPRSQAARNTTYQAAFSVSPPSSFLSGGLAVRRS